MGPIPASRSRDALAAVCAFTLGILITLVVRGYQFGHSNHTVYLLDALRVNDPRLLANDWFMTHTLQYHVVFTRVTAWLDRLGSVRRAYLAGYLALVVLMQLGWFAIVHALGGTPRVYLLSVMLFFLSAGGIGLGMYDFLQDSSFLPSNVANVAMLWGLYFWMTGRVGWAGLLLGIAGFFHLNHALFAIGLWSALLVWDHLAFCGRAEGTRYLADGQRVPSARPVRGILLGTIGLLALCLPNIIPAARASFGATSKLPLQEFVHLYVRIRHPHHYDPLTWPAALWISFLWPIPLAIFAVRWAPRSPALRQTVRIFLLFCGVLLVALLFCGVWYVSEPLIQMSLFRFSIYPKLLSCIGAAFFLCGRSNRPIITYLAVAVISVALIARACGAAHLPSAVMENIDMIVFLLLLFAACAIFELAGQARDRPTAALLLIPLLALGTIFIHSRLADRRLFGFHALRAPEERDDYLNVCAFARDHTPIDAVFLVPPDEEIFRLSARRAIVVNFKAVPQLSGELREWRDRLYRVLDWSDGPPLTHRFDQTMEAIARRYDALPAEHLAEVARLYQARYVITEHPVEMPAPSKAVFESGRYHLYDLNP